MEPPFQIAGSYFPKNRLLFLKGNCLCFGKGSDELGRFDGVVI